MIARERLLLLAFFGLILAGAAGARPLFALAGGVVGAVVGLLAVGRVRRFSTRMDARLGPDPARDRRFSLRRVLVRAGVHLGVLSVALFSTAVVPFLGDDLFAAAAAGLTAFPAVLTGAHLRPALPRRRGALPPA